MNIDSDVVSKIQEAMYPGDAPSAEESDQLEATGNHENIAEVAPENSHDVEAEEAGEAGDDESTQDADVDTDEAASDENGGEGKSLAEYLGVSEDQITVGDDGEVTVLAKVDGEHVGVPLDQLVKSYQLESHVQRSMQELGEQRKQFKEEKETFEQTGKAEFMSKLEQADHLNGLLEKQLMHEFQSINWEQLRQDDPAQYVVQRQDMEERAKFLENSKASIYQSKQSVSQEHQAKMAEVQAEYRKDQIEAIVDANPEWRDMEVRAKAMDEIQSGMIKYYGFTEADMEYVVDKRVMPLVQDALRYRQGVKAATEKKSMKVSPRVQKPGRPARTKKSREAQSQRAKLRATGSVRDLQAIIESKM